MSAAPDAQAGASARPANDLFGAAPLAPVSRDVPLSAIRPTDPTADVAVSADVMGDLGFISTPLLVELAPGDPARLGADGRDAYAFAVVDGERRVSEARKTALEVVPCLVLAAGAPPAAVAAARLVRNFSRRENPIREAEAIAELEGLGLGEQGIASRLKLPLATIRKRKRLLALPTELRAGIAAGRVKVSVGEMLANLPPSYVGEATHFFLANGRLKVKDVRALTRTRRDGEAAELPADLFGPPAQVDDGAARREAARRELEDAVRRFLAFGPRTVTEAKEIVSRVWQEGAEGVAPEGQPEEVNGAA